MPTVTVEIPPYLVRNGEIEAADILGEIDDSCIVAHIEAGNVEIPDQTLLDRWISLDLSTAHMPGPNPDWGGARAESHAFGWVLFLTSAGEEAHLPCPAWLKPIVKYALDNDCILVNFDQDADTYEVSDLETLAGTKTGFKTYNW